MSDIDTEAVNSLKVLDPKRPIREADIVISIATLSLARAQLIEFESDRYFAS